MTVCHPFEHEAPWAGRLFVRAQKNPYAPVPTITRAIRALAADQPVEHASTLEDIRAEVLAPDRLNAIVFGGGGACFAGPRLCCFLLAPMSYESGSDAPRGLSWRES